MLNEPRLRSPTTLLRRVHNVLTMGAPDYFAQNENVKTARSVLTNRKFIPSLLVDYENEETYHRFDQNFFFLNLYKCLLAARALVAFERDMPKDIIDLGSGSGAFSIALSLFYPARAGNFMLVDRGAYQLSVAASFRALLDLPPATLCQADALSIDCKGKFVVASYWLCGAIAAPALATEVLDGLNVENCLIVDYPSVVQMLFAGRSKIGRRAQFISTEYKSVAPQDYYRVHHNAIRSHTYIGTKGIY